MQTFFIRNRFVSNWHPEVKVLSNLRTRSSCEKQQQKSVIGKFCNIASKKSTMVSHFHSLSYVFLGIILNLLVPR